MFRNMYRKYIANLNNKSQKIRLRKQWIYEWYNVLLGADSRTIRRTQLKKEEKYEIQQYWEKIYGRKIPLHWHKDYYGFSGKLDKCYIPEYLYSTKLEPKFNPDRIARILNDKALTEFLFARVIDHTNDICVPETAGGCSGGFYYDGNRMPISKKGLLDALRGLNGKYIIKPCVGESSGHNVRLLQLDNGIELIGSERIEDIIDAYQNDFIIQKQVHCHKKYAGLHKESCNTLRIMSYRVNGKIKSAPVVMRIGSDGSYLDNAHAGGIYIAVSDNGELSKYAYDCSGGRYERHPTTGVVFDGYTVPYIDKAKEAASRLHACLPNIGFLHWDLCVNQEGQIVIIECNMSCSGLWIIQKAHGKGVFGEDTEYMISMLRSED